MDIKARKQELIASGMRPSVAAAQVHRELTDAVTARADLFRAAQEGITVGTRVWTDGGHLGWITAIHDDATATVQLDRSLEGGSQRYATEPIRLLLPTT